jgi:hypothetical protein
MPAHMRCREQIKITSIREVYYVIFMTLSKAGRASVDYLELSTLATGHLGQQVPQTSLIQPSEDLREEELRLTKLAENTKEIITMENTVLVKGQEY